MQCNLYSATYAIHCLGSTLRHHILSGGKQGTNTTSGTRTHAHTTTRWKRSWRDEVVEEKEVEEEEGGGGGGGVGRWREEEKMLIVKERGK